VNAKMVGDHHQERHPAECFLCW